MEVMSDYAKSEVGLIPADWFMTELGELITYIKGFPFKSSEYRNSGTRIIRVSDTTYDAIKEDDPIFVSERSAFKYVNWRLRENDLIVSTVGSKPPMYDSMVGKVIMIDRTHKNSLLNQNAVLIRDRQHRDYFQVLLLNHLRTKKYVLHIESIYRGNANQASITLKELFQFRIPLPVVELEQRAIAKALLEVDELLNSLDRLIAKKRDLKQAAMQQLLTGKTRLLGFSGEWEVKQLKSVAEISTGINKPLSEMGSGTLYVTVQDLYDKTSIRTERLSRIKVTQNEIDTRCLVIGDIVFGKSSVKRDGIGFPSQFLGCNEAVIFSGFTYRARARNGITDPTFLFYALREDGTRRWLIDNSQASALTNINQSIADAIPVQLPPTINEQIAIGSVLMKIESELTALEQRRNKTAALKQGMMQELLTGRTRLV